MKLFFDVSLKQLISFLQNSSSIDSVITLKFWRKAKRTTLPGTLDSDCFVDKTKVCEITYCMLLLNCCRNFGNGVILIK